VADSANAAANQTLVAAHFAGASRTR